MKILLHTCCGPCTIYPLKKLREEGCSVMGFFYRHNIHPLTECLHREETLRIYAEKNHFKVIWQQGYELEEFLQSTVFREAERCRICYHKRLTATALLAKRGKFDAFSTTLLYSRFQNHALIHETGSAAGKKAGVPFFYRDFREGWQEGIEESKTEGMYRQPYCGCIYSEKERYLRSAQHGSQPD
ncbi:epoxyqueuosine reductase QueH [Desulfobotulus sp. H1]|uniref:Epoxyqueuosine reductase QueH n=1 Tax=Desulfobotulus pelophilus TaxID=2823377 RepID=A0ABT3N8D4_9BACT|nr:epoxyqueuosine reductase QueH [Desulfobotulus pelophilus]MCW7753716.1 epoxyqueuosine reductase QueH [Desulfobotulus pelophilus]